MCSAPFPGPFRGPLPPPPPDPPVLPITGRHAVLFAATCLTLLFAGGFYWGRPASGSLVDILWAGIPFAAGTIAILGAHEMGHYVACRRYGIPATWPYFIPGIPPFGTFGAVIRIRGPIPDRRALFDVAAAGPIAGFAIALPLMIYGLATATPLTGVTVPEGALMFGKPVIRVLLGWLFGIEGDIQINPAYGSAWFGMLITALNLFPVGQLDGGHAVYACSRRLHRGISWAAIGGLAILLAAVAIRSRQVPGYILWLAILLWMRDRHPRLLEERGALDAPRRLVLAVLVLIFVLCFTPVPIYFA